MVWLLVLIAQLYLIYLAVRRQEQSGGWSWSKFFFALAFLGFECILVVVPLNIMNPRGRYYLPVTVTAGVVAVLNFIWFLIVCSRWRVPDNRISQ